MSMCYTLGRRPAKLLCLRLCDKVKFTGVIRIVDSQTQFRVSRQSTRSFHLSTSYRPIDQTNQTRLSDNRCLSTKGRAYLDALIGGAPKSNASSTRTAVSYPSSQTSFSQSKTQASKPNRSLQITGSSYLIPTMRLERQDTPESIAEQLSAALEPGSGRNTAVLRSMLQGKEVGGGGSKGKVVWRVPIVLDISAFAPDGSPHFSQSSTNDPQMLQRFLVVLDEFGINVVGVSGAVSGAMAVQAVQMGLPSIMARSSSSHRGGTSEGGAMLVHDVIQMVLSQQQMHLKQVSKDTPNQDSVSSSMVEEGDVITVGAALDKEDELPLPAEPKLPSPPRFATVYHGSVRSGQLVASERNQSVIIIGSVNSGGEVLSDGDIFIFGKLKGRAMAGLGAGGAQSKITKKQETHSPNEEEISLSARIFASRFDPELVCIGDAFTTVDDVADFGLERPGDAAMVSLNEDGELVFESVPLK